MQNMAPRDRNMHKLRAALAGMGPALRQELDIRSL